MRRKTVCHRRRNVALTKIKTSKDGCQKRREVMTFREAKEHLLYAFSGSLINDEDFALLYDLSSHFEKPELSLLGI